MIHLATLLLAAQISVLPAPTPAPSAEPFLFATNDSLLMSWMEGKSVRFARFDGAKWSEPGTIVKRDDLFANWADFPSIVEDGNGILYAHFLQKSSVGKYSFDVRMSVSRDGGKTWSESVLINRDGKQAEHGFVSLVPLTQGGVGIAWLDGRRKEMSLRYATVSARGVMANEVELDGRACECCATGMAMTSSGPLIAYRDRSAKEIRDISYVRPGSKLQPLHADGWKIEGCPVNGPQVDAIGDASVIAWFTGANDKPHVYVAFDGGRPIAVDAGKPVGRVDVVLLDRNTAVVSWLEGDAIRARKVMRDGKSEPGVIIAEPSSARASGVARIARIGREVYFAWTDEKHVRVSRARF